MKRILFIMAIAFLAACGDKKDPKAELADLKKQREAGTAIVRDAAI